MWRGGGGTLTSRSAKDCLSRTGLGPGIMRCSGAGAGSGSVGCSCSCSVDDCSPVLPLAPRGRLFDGFLPNPLPTVTFTLASSTDCATSSSPVHGVAES
eukprot:COSAG01_NODE_4489_length_4981_cov_1.951454_5_plen_99_part_00